MLRIGDFSRLSRISIRMLRHYDELGLLVPKSTDYYTSYRYYSEEQLMNASRITALKDMGFSLAVISEIMKNYDNPKALAEFLKIKQAEVQTQAHEINQRLLLLETSIMRLREDNNAMTYNVILKTLPERYVASVRKVIPSYNQEGILWNLLMTETAQSMNFQQACCGESLAVFHDEGFKENDVDVEIQIPVKGQYKDTENVVFKNVPEVEFASATYKGSYEQITPVNQAVAGWVNDNEYEFNGSMFCIYHVSPAQTSNPDEWVTEVCYPVRKK